MSSRRRGAKRRSRRTQSDILISVLKCTPSNQPVGISTIADKCGTTWRTTKKNIDVLTKAGIVEKVKEKGRGRVKYRRR